MIDTWLQENPIDVGSALATLASDGTSGALVTFTGHVRGKPGSTLELQHYPGMTEKMMAEVAAEASRRFEIDSGIVIHRHGVMAPGDVIVLVAVASRHRGDAFRAAEFLIDWLKTRAPFWKRETAADGTSAWVEARRSDDEKAADWT